MRYIVLFGFLLTLVGCTSNSTNLVLQEYRTSEAQKQLAMDNVVRTTNEQLLLNLAQRVRSLGASEQVVKAIQETWVARNQVDIMNQQYSLARMLTMVSVGPYLYDKQGFLNVMAEEMTSGINKLSTSADAGDKAAGISSVKDLIPASMTTRPSVDELFKDLKKVIPK